MFLDLSEPHFALRRHSVSLKNVHGPIRSSLHSLVHTLPTRKMFLDLSWRYLSPQPHSVEPEKCSWTYLGVVRLTPRYRNMFWTYPGITQFLRILST